MWVIWAAFRWSNEKCFLPKFSNITLLILDVHRMRMTIQKLDQESWYKLVILCNKTMYWLWDCIDCIASFNICFRKGLMFKAISNINLPSALSQRSRFQIDWLTISPFLLNEPTNFKQTELTRQLLRNSHLKKTLTGCVAGSGWLLGVEAGSNNEVGATSCRLARSRGQPYSPSREWVESRDPAATMQYVMPNNKFDQRDSNNRVRAQPRSVLARTHALSMPLAAQTDWDSALINLSCTLCQFICDIDRAACAVRRKTIIITANMCPQSTSAEKSRGSAQLLYIKMRDS